MTHPLAPTGRLRAAINVGNAVLASREGGGARGVSVDLATELARRLAVPLDLLVVEKAAASVDAVAGGQADIGFFAIDPARGAQIAFTPPYVVIEGAYLVREASPLQANEEVDRPATRVVVGQGSAYDLFLSRELRHATILRAPSAPAVVDHFMREGAEVAAGVRQQLETDMRRHAGLRLLPGRFMQIRQAMGCPKAYGPQAARALSLFVEEMKSGGFVAEALMRHQVDGASIAPAQSVA